MVKVDKPIKEKIEDFLNSKNYFTDALALAEQKTGVDRKYLFGGCVAVLSLYLVVGYASGFIVALLGFLYPAYASVKAIESSDKDDDTQWLTYWVVYSSFSIGEFFSDIFLSWFPLYFLFKCMFLCWCMAPFSWNGSEFIYRRFIQPFVMKHESEAEQLISQATAAAKGIYDQAEGEVKKAVTDHVLNNDADETEKDK